MIIAHLKHLVPAEDINGHIKPHQVFIREHLEKKLILMAGPYDSKTGGVIIFLSDDENVIKEIIQKDPFYIKNLAKYEFFKFRPMDYMKEIEPVINNLTQVKK